jgi:hypothetical protein
VLHVMCSMKSPGIDSDDFQMKTTTKNIFY